jgi:hypothetical protein
LSKVKVEPGAVLQAVGLVDEPVDGRYRPAP